MGVAPTGRRFSAAGMVFSRIQGAPIAEQWRIVDVFGLLQQLGVIPAPAQGVAEPAGEA